MHVCTLWKRVRNNQFSQKSIRMHKMIFYFLLCMHLQTAVNLSFWHSPSCFFWCLPGIGCITPMVSVPVRNPRRSVCTCCVALRRYCRHISKVPLRPQITALILYCQNQPSYCGISQVGIVIKTWWNEWIYSQEPGAFITSKPLLRYTMQCGPRQHMYHSITDGKSMYSRCPLLLISICC